MGCCLGTSRTPKPVPPHLNNRHHHHHRHHSHAQKPNSLSQIEPKNYVEKPETRSPPPPPPVEEESVKEVLSETPISKPQTPDIPLEKLTLSPPKEEQKMPAEPPPNALSAAVSEPSQLSESCGVSESYSYSTTTTATTIADAREDEATSNRKRDVGPRANGCSGPVRRKRPYSGEVTGQRERGPKPVRRTPEPAVGKRNRTETVSFRGRESSQMRTMQRNVAVPTGVRRETVSSRSRSPATRSGGGVSRAGRGKSPAKVTGRAGGSSSSVGVEDSEKKGNYKEAKEEVLAGKMEAKEEQQVQDGISQPQQQQQQGKESLDNPLVSLECFIFV